MKIKKGDKLPDAKVFILTPTVTCITEWPSLMYSITSFGKRIILLVSVTNESTFSLKVGFFIIYDPNTTNPEPRSLKVFSI